MRAHGSLVGELIAELEPWIVAVSTNIRIEHSFLIIPVPPVVWSSHERAAGRTSRSGTPRCAPDPGQVEVSTQVTTWVVADPGVGRSSAGAAGVAGGARSNRRLLEAVLLPADRGRVGRDAGQCRQARQIPGRKTDVADAVGLAELAAHGLLHGSPIRDLGLGPHPDDLGRCAARSQRPRAVLLETARSSVSTISDLWEVGPPHAGASGGGPAAAPRPPCPCSGPDV